MFFASYLNFWRIMWPWKLEWWCWKFSFFITIVHSQPQTIRII